MAFITYDIIQWCFRECPSVKELCPIFFDDSDYENEYVTLKPSDSSSEKVINVQPTRISVLRDTEWEFVEEFSSLKQN